MFTKLYEQIKKTIKQNFKILLLFIVMVAVLTIRLPFYINAPGGLIDVSKKIKIENSYKVNGSFNLAYVSEVQATIPTLAFALINKDWDIIKREDVVYDNETLNEALFRDKIMLEEANSNAIYLAFSKAGKNVKTKNHKVYITYIDEKSDTDLKIKDQILKINDYDINSKDDVYDIISRYKENDVLNLRVLNDGKEYVRKARIRKIGNRLLIGLILTETYDVVTDQKVELFFDSSESGPSGGLMLSLAIYNYLNEEDITNSHKIVGTGTIDALGNVGSIGGIEYKIKGAVKKKAEVFLAPSGDNYNEALDIIKKNGYNIKLVEVSTFDEALEKLKNL